MYKIIVVDDEPFITRSISQIISKSTSDFEVAAIAYDGESALKKIAEIQPELVFTDINMPKMSGLELAQKIYEKYPTIRTVILSGYSEFDYAIAAIKAGVAEYLVKPVNSQKISALLAVIKEKIDLQYYTTQLDIWNSILHHTSIHFSSKELAKYLPYQTYFVMLICYGSYLHSPIELSDKISTLGNSNYIYDNVWQQNLQETFWVINGYKLNEKILIIACDHSETDSLKEKLPRIHHAFNSTPIPVTSVLGTLNSQNLLTLNSMLFELETYLRSHIIFSKANFWEFNKEELKTAKTLPAFSLNSDDQKYISVLVGQKQYHNIKQYIKNQLSSMEEHEASQDMLNEFLKATLLAILDRMEMTLSFTEYQDSIYECIGYHYTYDAMFNAFCTIIDELEMTQNILLHNSSPQNVTAQQVRKYIEANFTQPINVQTLALTFGLVASYLSKIYSDYYGSSIKNDILDLRIKKAEELIKIIPPIPFREIADLSGFNDQFYFSKVFKKYHNMSPADFRKLLNNETE